jgi:MFS family permease
MSAEADAPPRFTLRRYPDLARIWFGHSLSLLGSHLSTLALPLLVLDTTGSAALAGLVGTVRMLTYLGANLPAGALADRLPRRSVLVLADLARAVAVLVVGVGLVAGHALPVAVLLAVGAVDTAVSAVAGPAGTAMLRHLVRSGDLPRVLALDGSRRLSVALAGPLLGGALYQVAPALPFLVDAVSYAASLLTVLSVRRGLGGGRSTRSTLCQDVAEGVRFVVRSRFILVFMVWATAVNFATAGMTFGVVVVIGPHDADRLGVAMTVLTLAGIAGSALAPRLGRWGQQRLVQLSTASAVAVGVVIALFPHPVVMVAAVAARALLAPAAAITFNVRVFALVPDEMTARVQSTLFLIGGAFNPFATLVSGWLCERFSPSAAFAVFAALLAVVLLVTFLPAARQP